MIMEKKMSLEESMKDLAASNRELAGSLKFYAETVNKYGLKIIESNGGEAPAAAAAAAATDKPTGGKPKGGKAAAAKAEPAAPEGGEGGEGGGDDGFGGGDGFGGETTLTFDDVKAKLLALMSKNGGDKTASVAIINKYGYASLNDIKDAHFEQIVADVDKAMKAK